MIQLHNITLDLGTQLIFQDISCVIRSDDRVGVLGRNGAGKSTLLKIIARLIEPTSGHITIQKQARIAYLPQEEVLSSTLPVFDEAFSAFNTIFEAQQKIERIEAAIAQNSCTDVELEEYAELQSQAIAFDVVEATQRTHTILAGLGFTHEMITKTVNELSTGWKMRLALAKLLLTDADMYLFDEPTNHLDIVTQQWLLNKLQSMNKGFILISHDRAYLEKVCTCILEIERGKGTYFRGNLPHYLAEKQQQIEIARNTRARQDREIAHKQAMADRFRASASRAQQAKNLEKQIERIELVEVEPPLPTINFKFPMPNRPGTVVLNFKNIAYDFNDRPLFKNISGEIQRDDRVALVAANGVGKTTLINCLRGKYNPKQGSITFGHGVEVAFFEQDQAQALQPEKTIWQEVRDNCLQPTDAEVRSILGAFQFSGDDVYKKIKVLSGGEKNRVAMTKVLLQRANFLILDEPTNHLDLYAKDVLYQALAAYKGTILFVSHDLDFVSKLATRILELTPTHAHNYPGTYSEFLESKQNTAHVAHTSQKEIKPIRSEHETKTLKKQLNELERNISKLESIEKKQIEVMGEHPYGSIEYNQALKKFNEAQTQLKDLGVQWETLLEKID